MQRIIGIILVGILAGTILLGCGLRVKYCRDGATEAEFESDKSACVSRTANYFTARGVVGNPFSMYGMIRACLEARGWRPCK